MNDLKSLATIFQNRIFYIPDFQRGYAWTGDEIEDLIGDIEDLERIRNYRSTYVHFTGTVIVKALLGNGDHPKFERVMGKNLFCYEVIDGQQRLTSLIILMNEIAREFRFCGQDWLNTANTLENTYIHLNERTVWLFHLGGELNNFFRQCVISDGTFEPKLEAEQKLKDAKIHFQKYIKKRLNKSTVDPAHSLDKLSETLTDALGFVVHEIDGEHEASVIFETVNSRGRDLTQFRKDEKSSVFLTVGRTSDDHALRTLSAQINDTWARILHELHAAGNKADDDQFLRYHWAIFPEALWFDENARDRTFDIHKAIKETSKTERFRQAPIAWLGTYLSSLCDYVEIYCDIVAPTRNLAFARLANHAQQFIDISMSIDRIGRDANLVPLLMAACRHFNDTPTELLELFGAIESFSFRLLVQGRYASTGRSKAFSLAADIASGIYDVSAARDHVRNQLINYYCDDRAFQGAISNTGNWYEWSGIRYFLFEYESHRSRQTRRSLPIDWDRFRKMEKDQTIEHVLPQGDNTLSNSYWSSQFTADTWKDYRHELGNLCICDFGANSAYSNNSFPVKCGRVPSERSGQYLSKTYKNSPFQSERDLTKFPDWDADAINQRKKDLCEFALSRWKS